MTTYSITPDNYMKITDRAHYVAGHGTRVYQGELVLCRDFMHTEEVAKLRQKYPNLTAIHCMISETVPDFWFNQKLGQHQFNPVFCYYMDNPSVVPGQYQFVRAEFCHKYFTPWYFASMCPHEICYVVNSLGDNCILTAKANTEFNDMLNFIDGNPRFIKSKISRWMKSVKVRQGALIKQTLKTEKQR